MVTIVLIAVAVFGFVAGWQSAEHRAFMRESKELNDRLNRLNDSQV